jgi:hypothetical protein
MNAHPNAAEACGRMLEHLTANGIDLRRTPLTLGMPLSVDPKGEQFPGNAAANRLLTREYRPPFLMPETV